MLTLAGVDAPPRRGGIARTLGFVRPYAFGAASAAYLFSAGWVKWRNRAAIVELCRHFGYSYDVREATELPKVSASDIVPPGSLLDVRAIDAVDGNVSERELVTICRIVRAANPAAIFEFGTFDGRTTLNLAANASDEARVWTLDLPRDSMTITVAPIHAHEARYADKAKSGSRFAGAELAQRIDQLYGDSGSFAFAPYYNSVDLVFVDASHAYEYVINDSLHAIQMLRNESGILIWHDYSRWDGVTRALNQLRRADERFGRLRWIDGTTLAYLKR